MNTQIRIGHFSPDAPAVNVLVDGNAVLENVSFGEISDYLEIDAGSYEVDVVPAAGGDSVDRGSTGSRTESGDSVISASLDLERDTDYTVLAIDELASIRPLVLEDENRSVEDRTQVRLIHASPDAPAVDVRVADGPTLFRNVEFGAASDYIGVDSATYDIDIMPADADDAVLSLSDVTLESGQTVTVFATGMVGDDTLEARLVTDFTADDARRLASQ